MEFCIKLLKDFSENEFQSQFSSGSEDDEKYRYHLEILADAGLIEFNYPPGLKGKGLKYCPRPTWLGNDFLDLVENESLWQKTKHSAKAKGVELLKLPLDLMMAYAKQQASQLLGIEIN